jgi:hypothetical protein
MITRTLRVLAWMLLLAVSVHAQSHRGAIRGRVQDASGAAVAGAVVTAVNEATNEARETTSGDAGAFALAELAPGTWRVEIAAQGHKTHVERVVLAVNQERRADAELQVGAISDRVEVSAAAIDVRRDSPAVGTIVENRQILDMPLDGRNFLELTLLAPGTVPAAQGSAGSVRGDFAFSVNGGREDFNSFLLDGADNIDPKLNTTGVRPPVDAIREFEVLTSTPEAAYGRQAASQVSVVMKSGTNQLQGTAFTFVRNGALDATNYFAPKGEPDPDYRRTQSGFSIGGPVIRDRTFFFADYEGTRADEGITRISTVPTDAARNALPAVLTHPVGRAIAGLYPSPNRSSRVGNYVASPTQRDRTDHFDVRGDSAFGAAVNVTARYSFADRRLFEPFSGPGFSTLPGYGNDVARRGQNFVASATHIFSPSLLNETRVAFTRVAASVFPEEESTVNRTVGLPEPWGNPRDAGLSLITVTGFSPLGHEYNNPQSSATNTIHIADTMTWTRGSHLVKAGFDGRLIRQNAFRDVQARGSLSFTGLLAGDPLTELLIGVPTFTTLAHVDNPQRLRTESYALFAQDSYRIHRNVTLSAGLRYDVTSPPVDADDRATLYDPRSGALVPVGTGGVSRAGYAADRNNLAPRIGAAWTIDRAATTVVRGAYGIHYNHSALAPSEGLYFSAPYFNFFAYFPSQLGVITLSDPFPKNFPIPTPNPALGFQPDLRTPFLHEFNVTVQRQLGATRVAEAAYVGSRGRKLIAARDVNQPRPSAAPLNLRPDPRFADITLVESRARSEFDSFQARFQQRYAFGCTMLVAYTLGRSKDDASGFFTSAGDPNFPQDSANLDAEWGRSSFDVRHRFSVSFSYELPFDFTVGGIVQMQSGRPFTVALLPEVDNSNTGRSSLGFGFNDRPNVSGDAAASDPTPNQWFNTSAFSMPAFGTFGNAGRNILEGPGYANVNLALLKRVPLKGRAAVQLRAEAFNLLNRTNFDLPDNFYGSPTFGQILSAGAPRHIQFGARVMF